MRNTGSTKKTMTVRMSRCSMLLMGLLLAVPASTAHAARIINSVSLNGGADWTFNADGSLSAPGDPVTLSGFASTSIEVTVTTSGSGQANDWESTAWRISTTPPGTFSCADTTDESSSGVYTKSFLIFAPLADGTYDAYFRAHDGDNCAGSNPGPIVTLLGAIVVDSVPNPPLGESCGLDIVMAWDGSGSIDDVEYAQMQAALVEFVEAYLVDAQTPTEFALVEFAGTAVVRQDFTNDPTTLINEINEPRVQPSGGFTNWQQGLLVSQGLFENRPNPDLIVFASDGNPNRIGDDQAVSEAVAVAAAVDVADGIKGSGIRILSIGIGSDLDVNNLVSISGPNVSDINPISASTDVITADFNTLADNLSQLAFELCGGTITVCKVIDVDGNLQTTDDQITAGALVTDWTFAADVTGGTPAPASGQTGADGKMVFDVSIDNGMATVDLTETVKPGFTLLDATCTGATNNGSFNSAAASIDGIVLHPLDIATCVFINFQGGACCLGSGECVLSPSAQDCAAQGGIYQGDGSLCGEVTCTPFGACCLGSGECVSGQTESQCSAQGGIYQGNGSICGEVTCTPFGACCLASGECVAGQTEAQCTAQGGIYQGNGSVCGEVTCTPFGACCLASGECVSGQTEAECTAQGGIYQGNGSICDQVTCTPFGACCLASGECVAGQTEAGCAAQGGVYQGNGSVCGEITCTPFGACCLGNGECTDDLTEAECAAQGGMYQGNATDCEDVVCTAFGACCLPDGSCTPDLTQMACESQGGFYQGDATPCGEVTCTGACCLPDATCIDDQTQNACEEADGIFQGPGSVCEDLEAPCEIISGACCQADGSCTDEPNETTCLAGGGQLFAGHGTDCATFVFEECQALPGACCLPDGTCQEVTGADACTAAGGTSFGGPGSSCAQAECVAVGACCRTFVDGEQTGNFCDVVDQQLCELEFGGEYQGDGTVCGDDGDDDGFVDACDNCPDDSNPGQEDCDEDGVGDACEEDCNDNGMVDDCEEFTDCNDNGVPDECDVVDGSSDCNENGIPDECETDCNDNGVPDDCDVDPSDPDGDGEVSEDCNGNDIPDECDVVDGSSDCNENGIPDECEDDCNDNGVPDDCDVDPSDPDGDGEVSDDCNSNGVPDECDPDDFAPDADGDGNPEPGGDGIPDDCQDLTPPQDTLCDPDNMGLSLLFSHLFRAPVCGSGCPALLVVGICGLMAFKLRRSPWRRRG